MACSATWTHSAYLPDRDLKDLENRIQRRIRWLGVDVAIEDGRVVVKTVVCKPGGCLGIRPGTHYVD
jgi:C-terminal processing protease CtpA/Prc